MENKTYKITLSDGTVIDNLELNGNNFISDSIITEDMFRGKLRRVEIYDGENTEIHEHMKLIQVMPYDNKYWFILADMTKEELDRIKQRADLEYLAMMAGIEL